MEGFLTLAQVMKKYNKTYTQVRYATETGRLMGQKFGWSWIYPTEQLPDTWPEPPRKLKLRREK